MFDNKLTERQKMSDMLICEDPVFVKKKYFP